MESGSDGEPEISEDFQAEFREENPFSYMQEENDDDADGTEVLPLRFTIVDTVYARKNKITLYDRIML